MSMRDRPGLPCNVKPSVNCRRTRELVLECRCPSCDVFDRDPFFSLFGYKDPRKAWSVKA